MCLVKDILNYFLFEAPFFLTSFLPCLTLWYKKTFSGKFKKDCKTIFVLYDLFKKKKKTFLYKNNYYENRNLINKNSKNNV